MDNPIDYNSCQIFGFAGIIVQIILACLSFSVLIYKRYIQYPKRPWNIWALDTSKQAISQSCAHFINVIISLNLSNKMSTCACNWYFSTNILDNTFGVFLTIGTLMLIQKFLFRGRLIKYRSGNYYTTIQQYDYQTKSTYGENKKIQNNISIQHQTQSFDVQVKTTKYIISYPDWLIQLIVWNTTVLIMKIIVFYIQYGLSEPIIAVSDFILSWIQQYQTLQLVLVIIVIPVIMNGLAFWIQDNFLKKKQRIKIQTLL